MRPSHVETSGRGPDELLALADRALAAATAAGAEAAEALITAEDSALTRFANSEIHQNVAESNAGLGIRVVLGGGRRSGVASTNRFDDEGLRAAAASAVALARLSEERDEPVALPEPAAIREIPGAWSATTAAASPELRAEAARAAIGAVDAIRGRAFGTVATTDERIAIATTTGIRAAQARTYGHVLAVAMADHGGSGYAESAAVDVSTIDAAAIGREAADRAARSGSQITVEPGDYQVVLEPYAVTEIMSILSYTGFSALAVEEGRSFMEPGRRLGSDLVSIWDDGCDPAGLPLAFDFEGVPKQHVDIIRAGISGDPVYDAQTAARAGRGSTGHGLPAPNPFGPYPLNLFMAPGTASREELVAGVERGLLVTRFWYTNPVQPKLGVSTGMTRDGTFLVEHGEIVAAVRNLRFTTSFLDALRSVSAVSSERRVLVEDGAARVLPTIRADVFTFTGATER